MRETKGKLRQRSAQRVIKEAQEQIKSKSSSQHSRGNSHAPQHNPEQALKLTKNSSDQKLATREPLKSYKINQENKYDSRML